MTEEKKERKMRSNLRRNVKEIITITEETILEEMIEILSLMGIDLNMDQIILITKIFKEKFQVGIITMLQN